MPRTKLPAKPQRACRDNTIYIPAFEDIAYETMRHHNSKDKLAEVLGVHVNTIHAWCRSRDEFAKACKRGQWQFDSEKVVYSLRDIAMGYEFDEVTVEAMILVDKDTKQKVEHIEANGTYQCGSDSKGNPVFKPIKDLIPGIKRKVVHKRIHPNVTACMFWLQNRMAEDWKNVQRQEVRMDGEVEHNHRLELDLTKIPRKKLEYMKTLLAQATNESNHPVNVTPLQLASGE